jgi:predicted RNase H-like HicB family nuclease
LHETYRADIQHRGKWWIGWVEEIPGVNSQGETREELIENLRSALQEALEMNRAEALAASQGTFEDRTESTASDRPRQRVRLAFDRFPPPDHDS